MEHPIDLDVAKAGIFEFFRGFPFNTLMGMELIEIEPGRARIRMGYRHDLCQPAGIMHGGAIASLIDTTIAHTLLLTDQYLAEQAKGGRIVSVDLRTKYLRPVSSGSVECLATVPRMGRHVIHAEAEVISSEDNKVVARGDAIYMMVGEHRLRKS